MEFNPLDIIGYVATVLTAIASFPQILKTIKTRSTKGTSLMMFLMMLAGDGLWLIYGIVLSNLPMIIGNAVGTSFYVILTTFKIINIARGTDTLKKSD